MKKKGLSQSTTQLSVFFISIVIAITALCSNAHARRALPDDNLAYPVLITLKEKEGDKIIGTGSGFFLNRESATFLVTARHVIFKDGTDELQAPKAVLVSYPKDPTGRDKNVFDLDLAALQKANNLRRGATQDVAIVRLGAVVSNSAPRQVEFLSGVVLKEEAKSGILGVGNDTVERFAEVLTGNQVFIFGFPTSIGLSKSPQIDHQRPLLRAGIVAGTNGQAGTIVLDCPVYGGNSGGPVLEVEEDGLGKKFRVIGVVTEFVPVAEVWLNTTHRYTNTNLSNSGYAIAVPMDAVLDLVSKF